MREGTVVVVVGAIDSRSIEHKEGVVVGTFVGYVKDKDVMVLLPNGYIFVGASYEIAPYEEQK